MHVERCDGGTMKYAIEYLERLFLSWFAILRSPQPRPIVYSEVRYRRSHMWSTAPLSGCSSHPGQYPRRLGHG